MDFHFQSAFAIIHSMSIRDDSINTKAVPSEPLPIQSSSPLGTIKPANVASYPKKAIFLIALALVVGGLIFAFYILNRATPLQQITLSNGKTVALGQSIESLRETLGEDLFANPSDPDFYRYPKLGTDSRVREEVLIHVANEKTVGIRIIRNENNKQLHTNATIGSSIEELQKYFDNNLTLVDDIEKDQPIRVYAYVYSGGGVKSYYFVNSCLADNKVSSVGIAIEGFESTITRGGSGCNVYTEK